MKSPGIAMGTRGVIAVDKVGNQILFLNPQTFEIRSALEGFEPNVHELAIAPDGSTAYAPIYGDGRHGDNPHPGNHIVVVDLERRERLDDLTVAPYLAPHGLRWGPRGELYCVCEDSGVVIELDAVTGEHRAVIAVGSTNAHRIEVLPDGSKLYTENEEDAFATVIDLRHRRRLPDVPAPGGLAGLAMHPDGTTVVLVSAARPELVILDTADDAIVRTVPLTGNTRPAQIARYSPDGRYLVVTSVDEDLATILDAGLDAGFRVRATVPVGSQPMDMAFAPDGRSVVIANQGDGTLTAIDLPSGRVQDVVEVGSGVETLAYY
ncbi:MAG: beta-propeller fold lactonase family protein [Mycobacterium sp.]